MRCEEVALGALVEPMLLDGDVDDVPGDMLLDGDVDDVPGDMLLGDVVLEASGDGVVLGVVLLLPDVLDPLLGAGVVRLTSPPEEFVTVPLEPVLLLGMQSVVIDELEADALVDGAMPLDVVPEAVMLPLVGDMLPLADARPAAESALVDAVTPVPLAPFVVFGPEKRCSGFVAVLRV